MNDKIRELVENCKSRISDLSNMAAAELQKIKSESLGKNSELTNLLKSMRDIPAEERPRFGQMVNEARKLIEEAGINQTRHKIFLNVAAAVELIMPTSASVVQTEAEVLVCESLLVGKVPEIYLDFGNFGGKLNLTP